MTRSFQFSFACSAAAALSLFVAACSSPGDTRASFDSSGAEVRDQYGWLQPSPNLARRIEVRANEAEFARTREEFVELTQWFCQVGEPAFPTLLDMAASSSPKTRQVGMTAVARLRDTRLLEPFRERVQQPPVTDLAVRSSYGRALLGMNDIEGVSILVDTMELHPEPAMRKLAYLEIVRHVTDNGIPFDAYGSDEERAESVAQWRAWYERTTTEMEPR